MSSLYEIYKQRLLNESLEVHSTLNDKLFNESEELIPEVRDKILEIVEVFKEYLEFPLYISDVRLVGSNASYNYTDTSDLDIHLIANFELVDVSPEFLNVFVNTKKSKFNADHNIKIKGIDAEVYVEDMNSTVNSRGVYSVLQNTWIVKPVPIDVPEIDIRQLYSEVYQKVVEYLTSTSKSDVESFIDTLYLMRKDSLTHEGEFGIGNLVFKKLRSDGYLDQLHNHYMELEDKELSLESVSAE